MKTKHRHFSKFFAFFLATLLVVGMLPTTAFAAGVTFSTINDITVVDDESVTVTTTISSAENVTSVRLSRKVNGVWRDYNGIGLSGNDASFSFTKRNKHDDGNQFRFEAYSNGEWYYSNSFTVSFVSVKNPSNAHWEGTTACWTMPSTADEAHVSLYKGTKDAGHYLSGHLVRGNSVDLGNEMNTNGVGTYFFEVYVGYPGEGGTHTYSDKIVSDLYDYNDAHSHDFTGAWKNDADNHWHECTANDGATDTKAAHVYDNDTDTDCNICGYTREVSAFLAQWDSDKVKCSSVENAGTYQFNLFKDGTYISKDYRSSTPNYDFANELQSLGNGTYKVRVDVWNPEMNAIIATGSTDAYDYNGIHIHEYSIVWTCNDVFHWHACIANDGATDTKAVHVYDNDTDTDCNICGYERTIIPPAPVTYTITKGNGQTVTKGNTANFVSDAPFDKFVKVQVDGADVATTNYTAVSGSTDVTFNADYINSLSEGNHTIAIVSNDGQATGSFTVKAASTPDPEPTPTEYAITINNGKASVGTGTEITKAEKDTVVTITANAADEGKEFAGWTVVSGSVTLADASKETTTFTMPGEEVEVTATYKDKETTPTDPTKPGDDTKPAEPTKPSDSKPADTTKTTENKTNSPKTGDNSNMMLWFSLLFLSGAGLTTGAVVRKKKRSAK